ncbi:MAG: EF-hand domain-containing protein [Geminicoccaceae bacterium]|jgi:Ca2+-binding EF-hand superfamily protein|nr:EF-hand domain-containing protein [Geminicoccaceae bacterium]MCB9966771.1 EF-hand domain-containing protein [Geminicoccaceae bacterium]HRY24385.1 EF-hand domain-containing protein [Geminicoccaceae bacterium]
MQQISKTRRALTGGAVPALALGLLLATGPAALAQQSGLSSALQQERMAFEVADTDGDMRISPGEFARDAAAGFSSLDTDGSLTLTPAELGEHDPALFGPIDGDGDGALTFDEVMTYKMKAFEAADTDGDGYLSFDEMVGAAEDQLGAAQ